MKSVILFIFLIINCFALYGAEHRIPTELKHISINEGLPHYGVTSLMKDSRDYLWIATYGGISIYDGYKMTHIKNTIDKKPLASNRVTKIAEDSIGNIWIATAHGITYYNRELFTFKEIVFEGEEKAIQNIFTNNRSNLIVARSNYYGLLIFNTHRKLIGTVKFEKGEVLSTHFLSEECLVVGTTQGAYLYDIKNDKLSVVKGLNNQRIEAITNSISGGLIIAITNGIIEASISKNDNGEYMFDMLSKPILTQYKIRSICLDAAGGLWCDLPTLGCCYIENYNINNNNKHKILLPNERVSTLLLEGDNNMWVSTYDNGLYLLSNNKQSFRNLAAEAKFMPTMVNFAALDQYRLLINTYDNELLIYNHKSRKQEPLPLGLTIEEQQSIRYLTSDNRAGAWIMLKNSYIIHLKADGSIIRYKDDVVKLKEGENLITAMCDSNGDVWLGFSNNLKYIRFNSDAAIKSVTDISSNPHLKDCSLSSVRVIYSDSKNPNIVWVGTESDGLYRIKVKESLVDSKIDNFRYDKQDNHSISSNFISSIMRHSNGTLWVGTEDNGIAIMEEESGVASFRCFTTTNGLSNDAVKTVVEDNNGTIWIGTNYGLNSLNTQTNTFYSYNQNNGLSLEKFWYGAKLLDSGEVIFGSVDGLLLFSPSNLENNDIVPNIEFSKLKILNRWVLPNEEVNGRVILANTLSDGDVIELRHNENIVSVGVDVVNHNPLHNYYIQYQILPLNEHWIKQLANLGEIPLNGLNPGRYTLNIAVNSYSGAISPTKQITIDIAYPPLASPIAITVYVILLITCIVVAIGIFLRITKLNYRLEIEHKQIEALKSLNNEKQRYFSNIAHELKTPLTLIIAPIEALARRFRFDVDITSKIDIILRQSQKMLQLIDATHKLHIDEINLLEPNYTIFDYNEFIDELIEDFRFTAEYNGKTIIIDGESIFVQADPALLSMAISNIINNALKYTEVNDTITISHYKQGDSIVVTIADSGCGINSDELVHIFERYYRGGNSSKYSSGIGLSFTKRLVEIHNGEIRVESQKGVGSTFIIEMKILSHSVNGNNSEQVTYQKSFDDSIIINQNIDLEVDTTLCDSLVYLVEDNENMRQMICEALQPHFRVHSFSNGEECLKQMQNCWPRIVVSDVMMDNCNGYELTQRIKGELSTSHIPVILLTGCNSIDDKIKGFDAGADDYIYKPFYLNHLVSRIQHLLRGREELRRRFEIGIPLEFGKSTTTIQVENDFIERLYALFDKNLDNENLDIDFIASEFLLSRSTLYQKIKSLTGQTTSELLRNYRLNKAAIMLEQGTMNVNEVYMSVGFKYRTHFSRLFKERYTLSPSQYALEAKGKRG